jgi:hypothetical protein
VPRFGERKPYAFLPGSFNVGQGQFSPDGRYRKLFFLRAKIVLQFSRLWEGLKRFGQHAEARMTEANSETTETMYDAFGVTTIVALDALTFSSSMAALAVYIARAWIRQGKESLLLRLYAHMYFHRSGENRRGWP